MPGESEKKELSDRIRDFVTGLRRGKIRGSSIIARTTVDILRRIIAQARFGSAQELMDLVRAEGTSLIRADTTESSIANMVRRILKIVREEFSTASKGEDGQEQEGASSSLDQFNIDYTQPCPNLRGTVIASIGELLQEIEGSRENIASQALEHIHADEIIMTAGRSRTVEAFLKNAGRKRKFRVIVLEGEPFMEGQGLAKSLSDDGIETTLCPDTHVFALMKKVNKVIIGTHTIMAEGGLKAPCGTYNIALAAQNHKVPILVCAGTYKLSPEYFRNEEQDGFQKYFNPKRVLSLKHMSLKDIPGLKDVEVGNVVFEHLEHEYIDLFVFNVGTNAPAMVYQLLKEFYHPDDMELTPPADGRLSMVDNVMGYTAE